jgi:hypothetical protein
MEPVDGAFFSFSKFIFISIGNKILYNLCVIWIGLINCLNLGDENYWLGKRFFWIFFLVCFGWLSLFLPCKMVVIQMVVNLESEEKILICWTVLVVRVWNQVD